MSSGHRFKPGSFGGRKGTKNQTQPGHKQTESIEANLEKLGFLADARPKSSSKHSKTADLFFPNRKAESASK
jgi:hypothetical protein